MWMSEEEKGFVQTLKSHAPLTIILILWLTIISFHSIDGFQSIYMELCRLTYVSLTKDQVYHATYHPLFPQRRDKEKEKIFLQGLLSSSFRPGQAFRLFKQVGLGLVDLLELSPRRVVALFIRLAASSLQVWARSLRSCHLLTKQADGQAPSCRNGVGRQRAPWPTRRGLSSTQSFLVVKL